MKKKISLLVVFLLAAVCFSAVSLAQSGSVFLTITPDTGLLMYDEITVTVEANSGATDVYLVFKTPDQHTEEWDLKELGAAENDGKWILSYSFWYSGDVEVFARVSYDNGSTWENSNSINLTFTRLGTAEFKAIPDSDTVPCGENIVIRFSDKEHVWGFSDPIIMLISDNEEYIDLTGQLKVEMTQTEMICETDDMTPGTYYFEFWAIPDTDGYAEGAQVVFVTVTEPEKQSFEWKNKTGVYTVFLDRTASFDKPVGSPSSVTIPATITVQGEKVRVTSIAEKAFKGNTKLKKISIGKNVEIIGANAFNGCTNLGSVAGMKGVTVIGAGAFQKCKSLTKFTIPSKVQMIGVKAFWNCSNLKTLTIQSTKLKSENVDTNAFATKNKKTIYKVPAKKLKEYRKWMVKKGVPAKKNIQ